MNILQLIASILGSAEQIVPIFVHNPKSQRTEAIIVSTVSAVLAGLAAAGATGAMTTQTKA